MCLRTDATNAQAAACSSSVSVRKSDSCRRGTTRQWPGLRGKASRKATARSFSATSPPLARRLQKTQATDSVRDLITHPPERGGDSGRVREISSDVDCWAVFGEGRTLARV